MESFCFEHVEYFRESVTCAFVLESFIAVEKIKKSEKEILILNIDFS